MVVLTCRLGCRGKMRRVEIEDVPFVERKCVR